MPKHTHVIEADSLEELKSNVAALNAALNPKPEVSISPSVAGGAAEAAPAKQGKVAKPKKEEPKEEEPAEEPEAEEPEAEESEAVDEEDPFAEEEAGEGNTKITRAQVDEALKKVGASKKGLPAVREICAALKVKKAKDIPEDSFAKALELCKKALK